MDSYLTDEAPGDDSGPAQRPPTSRWPLFNKLDMRHLYRENQRGEKEEHVSIMFSALPTSIQNVIPPFPSIRRTMTMPIRRSVTIPMGAGSSFMAMQPLSSSGASTPLSEANTEIVTAESPDDAALIESMDYSPPTNYPSTFSGQPDSPPAGSQSGVGWRCAKQGLDLVSNSGREARCRRNSDYSSTFERSSYVTGVGYLLNGLPHDLDDTEVMVLQRSIPPVLADSMELAGGVTRPRQLQSPDRNIVHDLVFSFLMYLQAWITWALPYAILFLGEILRLEHEHKVTKKAVALVAAWFQMLNRIGGGLVVQLVLDAVEYTIHGVLRGLRDFEMEMRASGNRGDSRSRSRGRSRGRDTRKNRRGRDYGYGGREYR